MPSVPKLGIGSIGIQPNPANRIHPSPRSSCPTAQPSSASSIRTCTPSSSSRSSVHISAGRSSRTAQSSQYSYRSASQRSSGYGGVSSVRGAGSGPAPAPIRLTEPSSERRDGFGGFGRGVATKVGKKAHKGVPTKSGQRGVDKHMEAHNRRIHSAKSCIDTRPPECMSKSPLARTRTKPAPVPAMPLPFQHSEYKPRTSPAPKDLPWSKRPPSSRRKRRDPVSRASPSLSTLSSISAPSESSEVLSYSDDDDFEQLDCDALQPSHPSHEGHAWDEQTDNSLWERNATPTGPRPHTPPSPTRTPTTASPWVSTGGRTARGVSGASPWVGGGVEPEAEATPTKHAAGGKDDAVSPWVGSAYPLDAHSAATPRGSGGTTPARARAPPEQVAATSPWVRTNVKDLNTAVRLPLQFGDDEDNDDLGAGFSDADNGGKGQGPERDVLTPTLASLPWQQREHSGDEAAQAEHSARYDPALSLYGHEGQRDFSIQPSPSLESTAEFPSGVPGSGTGKLFSGHKDGSTEHIDRGNLSPRGGLSGDLEAFGRGAAAHRLRSVRSSSKSADHTGASSVFPPGLTPLGGNGSTGTTASCGGARRGGEHRTLFDESPLSFASLSTNKTTPALDNDADDDVDDETECLEFLSAVTSDVVTKHIADARAFRTLCERHINERRGALTETKMRELVHQLQQDLGMGSE